MLENIKTRYRKYCHRKAIEREGRMVEAKASLTRAAADLANNRQDLAGHEKRLKGAADAQRNKRFHLGDIIDVTPIKNSRDEK